MKLEGKSGDINVSGKASAVPGGKFSADLSLDAPNSRPILSLFAMGSETEDGFPGSLAVKAEGRSGDDLETSVVLQALGARIVYGGRMDLRNDGLGLDGQLNFGTTDAAPLLRAAGFPVAVSTGTALVAETPVNWTGVAGKCRKFRAGLGCNSFPVHLAFLRSTRSRDAFRQGPSR